jgi:signal transduction histidine kinase
MRISQHIKPIQLVKPKKLNFVPINPKSFLQQKGQTKQSVSLSRDFYIYAGFILAIVLSSSLWSAITLYNSQKAALQDQLITQSQLIDTELSNYLNHVSHIAEDKGHKIALKQGDLNEIDYLFKRNFFFSVTKSGLKRKAFIWPHFSWVDKKGNILVKSEIGILAKPERTRDFKYLYQSTINSWQLHLSEPYFDTSQDKTFIDASLGVSNLKTDKYIGSITTRFNIEKLVEAIKLGLKPDTKFIVLDEEFKIIIQSDDNLMNNDDFFVSKLANIDPEAEVLIMDNRLKYRGDAYKIYRKSSDYPFIILTGYDSKSFNKEFTINIIERFVALFGAAFFIGIILFFQRKRIIKEENVNKKLLEENNLKLVDLNNKLEHQNELAKKSKKSQEKFLSETRQNIIEDTVINISKDIATILDGEAGNIILTKKTSQDLHKNILGSCAKILAYVSDNLNLSQVNVKKIITDAIEMAHYDANVNEIELIADIEDKIVDIYVDERSIKHVIIALINYAMEDRKRGSNSFVKIIAKNKKDGNRDILQIIFEDNGHGISEEMRMNFQQNAEKEGKNGNNISLSLQSIKSILGAHKSTLQINNVFGEGSVMTIEIPYVEASEKLGEKAKNEINKSANVVELFPRK